MEPKQQKAQQEMGVFIKGMVIAKNEYVPKNGGDRRYTLDVAIPGNRANIPVSVSRDVFDNTQEMSGYDNRVLVSTFNNSTFFAQV